MQAALSDLFSTGKGIIAMALLIGATVLTALGRMTVDQWTNFAEWIFGTYAAAKAATTIATTIAGRPTATPGATTAPAAPAAPAAADPGSVPLPISTPAP